MKRIYILSLLLFVSTPAYTMTCEDIVGDMLTPHSLGTAWQTADWRDGLEPLRYYNVEALKRIVEDPDLKPFAQRWLQISKTADSSAIEFMDITYQYLVFLADVRIKFDVPIGGDPDQPKPLLGILETLMDAREETVETSTVIETIESFLKEFVHPELGVNVRDQVRMGEFINQRLRPQIAGLQAAKAFR